VLPVGENMQVTVDFQPLKSGEFKKDLVICYDSNELVYVTMYGASQDINVRLDKNSLRIEDTYITMTNQRTVTIHNRSDIIVHYEWKKFATIEEEEQQKLKELATLSRDEENAKNKLSNQSPDYIALLSRNFQNKTRNSQNKPFHFDDNVFLIQPIEGDIWPNSTCEVSIIFRPDFAQTYNKTAYCEVTGRESRLPLRLSGIGSGPKVQLSIENLEIGNVFIGSTHVFEVVLANKGFIDAIYSVNIPNTAFGKFFSFEPNEGLISPNSYQAVSISFGSNKLGDFSEVFEFAVDGKLEKYKMTISGSIIPPTFKFDTDKIRFNQVSYGFKYSHNCVLKNTSLVPMTFSLRVASDSESSNHNVKEFSIKPNTGTILPQSDTKILLEFVPSFIKKYETNLVVDIEDVATELLLLPITARSGVPNINLLTNNVDMGRCFIYYPYEKYIKLSNESTLRARYSILPSDPSDVFKFTSNQAEGVIEPNTIKEICIIAEAVQLNEIECDLLIKINGSPEPPIKCHFTALCQGPVVLVSPRDLDWGQTTVLIDSCREILITNESLIEAKFSTSMVFFYCLFNVNFLFKY
jgi:hydrocephalus-inducing protein